MDHEVSQVLGRVFESLRAEDLTKRQIAKELHFSGAELEALTFGVDVMDGAGSTKSSKRSRADLKLVK